jgi:hypothetical protein
MSFFGRLLAHAESSVSPSDDEKKLPEQIFDPILGSLKFVSGRKSLYVTRAKLLRCSEKVIVWELNRPLDAKHVNTIYESFESEYKLSGQVTIFGSLAVFKQNDYYKIFDGQHRLAALTIFIDKHPTLNPELTLEVYETEDPIALFSNLNQIKPQDPKHNPSSKKEELSKRIQDEYKDSIRNQSRANRPRVILKAIMDTINTSDFCDDTVDEIMDKIQEYNIKLSELGMQQLFGREYTNDPELCHRLYEQAGNLNFYLGVRKLKNGRLDLSIPGLG